MNTLVGKQGIVNNAKVAADEQIAAQLDYYVYALADEKGEIFYVGKGINGRIFDHINEAKKASEQSLLESQKLTHIKDLLDKKQDIRFIILRSGLCSNAAYELEGMMIDFLTCRDFNTNGVANLLNVKDGHHNDINGIKTIEQAKILLVEDEATITNDDKIIAISINRSYNLRGSNVYDSVRSSWHVGISHAKRAQYIAAVYLGVVVGVYENNPKKWKLVSPSDKRYEFEADEIKSGDVYDRLFHKRWPSNYKFGKGNPIRYTYK